MATSVTCVLAQQAGENLPPLPPGPLVQLRAPESSRWIIAYNPQKGGVGEGEDSSGAAPKGTKRVVYTKQKEVMLEQTAISGKPVKDRWMVGQWQYSMHPVKRKYVPYSLGSFPPGQVDPFFYTDLSQTDFPGFEWIKKEDYAGIHKVLGRECIMYRRSGEGEQMTAYVDLRTRFPVVLRKGSETRVYEFHRPPAINLPGEIQADFKARTEKKTP